jgi:6-phosphogluconolactonase (cycloisomerase 2 family)
MRAKVLSPNGIVASTFALTVFLTILPVGAAAQIGDNFVYVMTNKSPHNSIVTFRRASDGALTFAHETLTGGSGTGPNGADPLGSQDSLVLSGDGLILLAVNAGSNEISVLARRGGALTLLSKTFSGGTFPNSIALSGDLVYVLNSKGNSPNVTGFRLDVNGRLHWIATVDLPPGSAGANDIRFAPDGSELLVTVSATNEILVFPIASDGTAANPVAQASAGNSPFGIRFGHNSDAIISEAAGSVSSYQLTGADMLSVISGAVSDTQMATCWISVPRDGKFALVSNTGSGTLSLYSIDANGSLALLNAIAANPGGAPIDSALSRDGKFLYVDESAQGKVLIFRVGDGSLTQLGSVSLQEGIQGIAAQ